MEHHNIAFIQDAQGLVLWQPGREYTYLPPRSFMCCYLQGMYYMWQQDHKNALKDSTVTVYRIKTNHKGPFLVLLQRCTIEAGMKHIIGATNTAR